MDFFLWEIWAEVTIRASSPEELPEKISEASTLVSIPAFFRN